MEISKLKIDKYTNIKKINFPEKYDLPINTHQTGQLQVVIYYIDCLKDVEDFIAYVKSIQLAKDNRVIFVYEKGRKDGVNRDTIFDYFVKEKEQKPDIFKMRSPMLCLN